MRRFCLIVLVVLALFNITVAQDISEDEIRQFFFEYIRTMKTGDLQLAADFWSLYDRTLSNQLGINFQDVPFKLDAGSPLLKYASALREGDAEITVGDIKISRGFARIDYTLTTPETSLDGVYYANVSFGAEPRLATPLQVFTENWDLYEGKYLDLRYRDPTVMTGQAVAPADDFIRDCAARLQLSPEKMSKLEQMKFRVFLCSSHGEVKQFTGEEGMAVYSRSCDAAVSKYMPPYDQLAQFLVYYANDSLPYHTLPFMKHGTNTFLGGRNGRPADLSLAIGKYVYTNDFSDLEGLMTQSGFIALENNPDFSYPPAALFCEFLFDQLGVKGYFDLYRKCSGSAEEIEKFTAEKFKSLVSDATGKDWAIVQSDFKTAVAAMPLTGIFPTAAEEGELIYQSGLPHVQIKIYEDNDYYHFVVNSNSNDFKAILLAGPPPNRNPYQSFLFSTQIPDREYVQEVYGVMLSPLEVGTYNYLTNEITGKYIVGFTGDEVLQTKEGEYRFHVDKSLLSRLAKHKLDIIDLP